VTDVYTLATKLDDTRVRLGSNVSPEMILQMWDRWDRCLMDHASTSDSSVDYSFPALDIALSKFPYTKIVFLLARAAHSLSSNLDTLVGTSLRRSWRGGLCIQHRINSNRASKGFAC
jgi:hypothetical protein